MKRAPTTKILATFLSALALLVAPACNRSGASDDAVETAEATEAVAAEGSGAEEPGPESEGSGGLASPAPVPEPAAPSIAAHRPDALIAALPAGEVLVAVDIRALAAWASFGVGDGAENARSAADAIVDSVVDRLLYEGSIDLGQGATAVAITWSENGAAMAFDAPPENVVGLDVVQGDSVWTVSLGRALDGTQPALEVAADAVVTARVGDRAALPDGIRESLDFLDPFEVGTIEFAVRADGSAEARLAVSDGEAVGSALGRGQAFVSQALGQYRSETRPELQGWVTYANRATQGLFARVSVESADGATWLRVPPPTCGSPLRNLGAIAFALTAADVAANDPRTPSIPYVEMEGAFAEGCGGVDGPAPTIPARFASFGAESGDLRGMLLVVDLPAVLRAGLPTAFGLLPFALDAATIEGAFGARPMGLNGLDDDSGHLVYARERTESVGSPATEGLVLPGGMTGLVGEEEPLASMNPFFAPHMVGWATGRFVPVVRGAREPSQPWTRALEIVPDGAMAAAVVNSPIVRGWAEQMDPQDPMTSVLLGADAVVVTVGEGGIELAVLGVPTGLDPASVRTALPDALAAISRASNSGPRTAERRAIAAAAIDRMDIAVADDILRIRPRGGAMPMLAAAIRIGLPMLATTSGRGGIGIPQAPTYVPSFGGSTR